MSLWGKTDNAANSVLWGPVAVNKTPNTVNQTLLFGNTTANAFISGETVGQFGLDTSEMTASGNASVLSYVVTAGGSGYRANTTVTVTGTATANARTDATGRVIDVRVVLAGNAYSSAPTVTVAAPPALKFSGNAIAVNVATDYITLGSNAAFLANGDLVTYTVGAGNTAITGLTNATSYYVVEANTTAVKLSTTYGGSAINVTAVSANAEPNHFLTGQTASAVAVITGAKGAAHSGWVLRTVGTGGRAGRITYETLVATGSITSDSEDTVLKDS
jgi:TolB-like protein